MYQYNLFILAGGMVANQWMTTDVNLLEMYKASRASGQNVLMWEKGMLNLDTVLGIIDVSPPPIDQSKSYSGGK